MHTLTKRIHRVVLTTAEGTINSIVTQVDLLNFLQRHWDELGEDIPALKILKQHPKLITVPTSSLVVDVLDSIQHLADAKQ